MFSPWEGLILFSDELFKEDTEVLPKLCGKCRYVLEIDWMKKLSQQGKEPRNSQQEKKCIKKLHGFCCDTKFKKSISGVS